jgi:glucose dehydrogenase
MKGSHRMFGFAAMLLLLVNIAACSTSDSDKEPVVAGVAHSRTYDEQRFSPLTQVIPSNVEDLSLDWHL